MPGVLHHDDQQQHDHEHDTNLHDLHRSVERQYLGNSKLKLRSDLRVCDACDATARFLRDAPPALPVHDNDHHNDDNDHHNDDDQFDHDDNHNYEMDLCVLYRMRRRTVVSSALLQHGECLSGSGVRWTV